MSDTKALINPPPKKRFMESGTRISRHREMMQSPDLRTSLDYALLEYQRRMTQPACDQIAAAAHFKLAGATEFVDLLLHLAEANDPTPTPKRETVNHTI